MKGFILVLLWALCGATQWSPQLGTVQHPKSPNSSPFARKGDYYKIEDNLYYSLCDADLNVRPWMLHSLPDNGGESECWQHIKHGSYLMPKVFGEDFTCEVGDIFHESVEGVYYRAKGTGNVLNDWHIDIIDRTRFMCRWEVLNANEDWMTLLRPIIGDTRLGDLVIPGVHDAGTWGITEDSILVDRNFLFQVAEDLSPATVVNWSVTQPDKFDLQLSSGFRNLDMRIADTEEIDGLFHWWHGMTGDEITEGLDHVGTFARTHTEEILILDFQHFASPGNAFSPTLPIPERRLDVISDMILASLGDQMTYRSTLSSNPTVNEVLDTGRNIIAIMKDGYIRAKDDRYWESVIHASWSGVSNPEDLFEERSSKLEGYRQFYADELTDISGATTPSEKTIVAGLINVYGDNETVWNITLEIIPGLEEVVPSNMSFEGLWYDLPSMARYGTNTYGMRIRPDDLYSNGASVHYSGTNAQLRHWLARPDLYKPNIIYTDDFLSSSFVDTAILYNSGQIPREVTVAHQGNTKSGYYIWDTDGVSTIGGKDGVDCTSVTVQYSISDQEETIDQGSLSNQGLLDLAEGQYPPGAVVNVEVSSEGSAWYPLWSGVIQEMIDTNNDVYIRGTDTGDGTGFAYVSTVYNDYGLHCLLGPSDTSNILASVQW